MKTFGVWNDNHQCWVMDKNGKIMEFLSKEAAEVQAIIEGSRCVYYFVARSFQEV